MINVSVVKNASTIYSPGKEPIKNPGLKVDFRFGSFGRTSVHSNLDTDVTKDLDDWLDFSRRMLLDHKKQLREVLKKLAYLEKVIPLRRESIKIGAREIRAYKRKHKK